MRAHWTFLTIAAIALATPAMAKHRPADPPRRAVITNPDWVRYPKSADLFRLYPEAAAAKRVAGRTKALCHILADGALDTCVVIEECPEGYGFGRATLTASQDFQMRPKTVDGVPVEDGMVLVPMVWTLDASTPPPACGSGGGSAAR